MVRCPEGQPGVLMASIALALVIHLIVRPRPAAHGHDRSPSKDVLPGEVALSGDTHRHHVVQEVAPIPIRI